MPCQDGGRGAWPCSGPSSRKATQGMLRAQQNPHKAAPKVPHSLQSVPGRLSSCGAGYGNMSSLTLHSPSHLLEGQYVEQDTKKDHASPWPHSSHSQPLISPAPSRTPFNHPRGEEKVPGEQTLILCMGHGRRGRILWKHHTQLCKGLSRNSTMF